MASFSKVCKDCKEEAGGFPAPAVYKRPSPFPGPRCYSHHKAEEKRLKEASHARRVARTYGLKDGQYEELYAAQGGVCAICRRATGKVRKLAVDHDHKTGYVRGLLCKPCNSVLAHFRDDINAAGRVFSYLLTPPAFNVIGLVKPSE